LPFELISRSSPTGSLSSGPGLGPAPDLPRAMLSPADESSTAPVAAPELPGHLLQPGLGSERGAAALDPSVGPTAAPDLDMSMLRTDDRVIADPTEAAPPAAIPLSQDEVPILDELSFEEKWNDLSRQIGSIAAPDLGDDFDDAAAPDLPEDYLEPREEEGELGA